MEGERDEDLPRFLELLACFMLSSSMRVSSEIRATRSPLVKAILKTYVRSGARAKLILSQSNDVEHNVRLCFKLFFRFPHIPLQNHGSEVSNSCATLDILAFF